MNSEDWTPNMEFDAGEYMCHYTPGCPDPTASNYLDPISGCIPDVGPNGNVYSCTDCEGNPPSSVWGLTAQGDNTWLGLTQGQLLYPSAIIPGTLGDTSCCYFDAINDMPVGCSDPMALNFNDPINYPGNIDCANAINNGDPCFDNGTCIYGTLFEVWCCDFVTSSVCEDYSLYNQASYDNLMNSAGGMCHDLQNDCIGMTPCTS